MKITIKDQGLKPKELTDFLLKFLLANGIDLISSISIYLNPNDKRQFQTSLNRKDYDMIERVKDNFDKVAF